MTEKREHLTSGRKLTRSEATRRLLAAIIWQMTVAIRRVDTTRLETAFQSPNPGRDDGRAAGVYHRNLTPTTEESSTAMPYPYTAPESNPRDPGQCKQSQTHIPPPQAKDAPEETCRTENSRYMFVQPAPLTLLIRNSNKTLTLRDFLSHRWTNKSTHHIGEPDVIEKKKHTKISRDKEMQKVIQA
ncbi:hypothetical protein LAZ67_23001312 [Cordylochernes scorpioides]|uniref:Uncharacterized protein n=1 Tax=Cordylochernes scorpioides TaxID=51811 RepID=A0ABY6LQS0_9ARAC|nr:hypothetical protein LAZ67_23001312 [Cordylochernes scorpioides]